MFNPRPLPATQQGIAIVTAFKAELDEFHGLVDGRVVAIHDMLNTIGTHYPPPSYPPLCLPAGAKRGARSLVSARHASSKRLTAGAPREPSAQASGRNMPNTYTSCVITSARARTFRLHPSWGGKWK